MTVDVAKKKEKPCGWTTMRGGWPCLLEDGHEPECVMPDFGLDLALVLEAARARSYTSGYFLSSMETRLGDAIRRIERAVPKCGVAWPTNPEIKCSLLAAHDVKLREHSYITRHAFRDETQQIEWDLPNGQSRVTADDAD